MSKVVITRYKLDSLATTISAKSGEPLPLTIAQMDAAVQGIETGGNDLIVTLSYNESTEMWEPDCTYAEASAAYEAGKTVAFECDEQRQCSAAYEREYNYIRYYVYDDGPVIASNQLRSFLWDGNGVTEQESHPVFDAFLADAVESDVAQGKMFVNSTGYHAGTATAPTPTLQSKSVSYTPSETAQSATVMPDSGYDGLSSVAVSVGAISSTYVGSEITRRSSTDLTASGATVNVPAGYYSAQASKAVASGTAGTPTATKGTVSNHSVSVTPSVNNTAGYITGGTKSGTAVTVSASELVSGSETKTENGTYDVTNLASLVVNVAGGGSAYRRIEVCPQQTATPNSSRQATLSNVVGSLSDGLHYVVTYDGSEYYTTCEMLWGTDSIIGEPSILFNTVSDVTYPFAIDWTSSSTLVLVANDTQQHTVKVERLELIEEPVEFVVYHTSSSEPTSSQGSDGDIWLVMA